MTDALAQLYEAKRDRQIFGVNWIGPPQFEHAAQTLIACYQPTNPDGKEVWVYCTVMPATFYKLVVKGNPEAGITGYTISTGSGCAKWSAKTAEHIASGMVDFQPQN